jgi:hypothetical protein
MASSNFTVAYSDIDYGYKLKLNFRQKWDAWSMGVRAAVAIGMTAACLSPYFLYLLYKKL